MSKNTGHNTSDNDTNGFFSKIPGWLKTVVIVGLAVVLGSEAFNVQDLIPNLGTEKSGTATSTQHTDEDITDCPIDTLPKDVDPVVDEILTGSPGKFPEHDGKHFGNYEGVLPQEKNSYYREYTVTAPSQKSRGIRRIVVGGGTQTDPDVWYYTDDHFESFCEIPDAED